MSPVSGCLSHRGSLLVITLWLIAVLAMVAVALSRFLSTETRLIRYYGARAQARAWAQAGVRLGLQRLREDTTNHSEWLGERWAAPSPDDPANPMSWVVPVPGGTVTVIITDEERRLNLNTASEPVLAAFLGNSDAARALVGYRNPGGEGMEQGAQSSYRPKHGPLVALEEAWEIPEIRDASHMHALIQQHATVWTDGNVNLNTASAEVLTALPADTSLVERLIAGRPGPDGRFGAGEAGGTDDDCKAITDAIEQANQLAACAGIADATPVRNLLARSEVGVASAVFRIHAQGETAQPMTRYQIEAIVKRQGEEEPAILAWREQP